MDMINAHAVINSVVFSLIGIFVLVVSFFLVEMLTPENLYKELVEKQNSAVAIVAGAFILAIAIIIAFAIHG
ncbi:MAG: DUF350 domain-containing protein [Bacteroidetes bacterium]|nr:DUF350 domain-containing protein [Bacteroidota bacterium]